MDTNGKTGTVPGQAAADQAAADQAAADQAAADQAAADQAAADQAADDGKLDELPRKGSSSASHIWRTLSDFLKRGGLWAAIAPVGVFIGFYIPYSQLGDENSGLRSANLQLETRNGQLIETNRTLVDETREYASLLRDETARADTLERRLERLQDDYDDTVQQLQRERAQHQQDYDAVIQQIAELEREVSRLSALTSEQAAQLLEVDPEQLTAYLTGTRWEIRSQVDGEFYTAEILLLNGGALRNNSRFDLGFDYNRYAREVEAQWRVERQDSGSISSSTTLILPIRSEWRLEGTTLVIQSDYMIFTTEIVHPRPEVASGNVRHRVLGFIEPFRARVSKI